VVPTARVTAASLRPASSRERGPGTSVTRRRSWGRAGPPVVVTGAWTSIDMTAPPVCDPCCHANHLTSGAACPTCTILAPAVCDPDTMVSVDRLIAEPGLDLAGLHLPDGRRSLRWVATSELTDPTPYLLGGELLLTTGLGSARWTTRWDEYVVRLKDADVAALGLGVGLTHESAPTALVDACRTHGLNLLTVPRPTAFVAVSRTVAALLDEEAEQAARQALEAQRLLTRAALRNDDAAILRQLSELIGG